MFADSRSEDRIAALARFVRVACPPFVRSFALTHGGALLLLALVVSVEQAAAPTRTSLPREVVVLWAHLAPALCTLAAALAWVRMQTLLLALGCMGCRERRVRGAAWPLAVLAGACTLLVPSQGTPAAWIRGDAGWFHLGRPIPDVVGAAVGLLAHSWAWTSAGACLVATVLGARRWRSGSLALVVVGSLVGDGITEGGGLILFVLAWLATACADRSPEPPR